MVKCIGGFPGTKENIQKYYIKLHRLSTEVLTNGPSNKVEED